MRNLKLVTIGLLAIVAAIVIFQNTESVETRLLFATVTMPRALLLILTLAVGFVLGLFFAVAVDRRKTRKQAS